MARQPLFSDGPAADVGYANIRAAANEHTLGARRHCEALWEVFEPHADREFLVEIRNNFDARYWEMYLAACLVQQGYDIRCPKPGPDVGIELDGRRVWFEATSPTRGADGAPDQVPERKSAALGEDAIVQDVPNERIVLRYLNSISEKYQNQLASWRKHEIVGPDDAFVIAINPRPLGWEYADTEPPRILQAAFTLGPLYIMLDRDTLKKIGQGYHFRDGIIKVSGRKVPTGVFHLEEYTALSGLLCSRVDAVNRPEAIGADFQLVPNPWAAAPLPEGFRLTGTYFRIEKDKDGYTVIPENGR